MDFRKKMFSKIKFPTILGLMVLLLGLGSGVFLTISPRFLGLKSQASISSAPKNITLVNISDTSAAIYWQTEEAIPGFVQANNSSNLDLTFKDDRDNVDPRDHKLHFVTLTNLTPNTIYSYKITSGTNIYPVTKALTFQTTATLSPLPYQPIIGSILDQSATATDEALVILDIPGAQKLATITKFSGNFILPLANIKDSSFSAAFDLPESGIIANLNIFTPEGTSQVSLKLPLKNNLLSPITLGKDLDLTQEVISPSATPFSPYDLNHDGVINSLDASILMKSYGKKTFDKTVDLNQDGIVNQKDVSILNKLIPNSSPK